MLINSLVRLVHYLFTSTVYSVLQNPDIFCEHTDEHKYNRNKQYVIFKQTIADAMKN